MKDDFDYSPLEEIGDAVLDFENVYESGRFVKQIIESESKDVGGAFIVRNGKPEAKFAGEEFTLRVEKLIATFVIIRKILLPKVNPAFIELSIFDPDDPNSDSFYTLLFGRSAVVRKYLGELEYNIVAERRNSNNRGALLPTPALYQAAHYSKRYYGERIPCEKLTTGNISIYLGSFKVSAEDDDNFNGETADKIRSQVDFFFNAVMKGAIKNSNGRIRSDFAMLVPIARPVGINRGEVTKKMRGGGLFAFGEWRDKTKYHPGRAALRILNILHRAVMNVSQARIESVKALDALHEHAYDTQGHELRKLIPWITKRTPEPILANLRMYFNSLFAISEADVDKLQQSKTDCGYPKEFAAGETLKEFIINAARIALRVERMIAWCSQNNSREVDEAVERGIELELNNLVNKDLDYLIFDKTFQHLFKATIEGSFKQRWYFFGALVAAFRNITAHQKDNTEIEIFTKKSANVLIICNQGHGTYDAVADKVVREKEKNWRGSTGSTLKFFVIKYNANPEKVEMKWRNKTEEDLAFLTVIPFPDNFL